MTQKPSVSSQEGEEAASALLSFWKKGRASRKRLEKLRSADPDAVAYGKKLDLLKQEAERADLNPDLMQKAWRLAEQYEKAEIQAICKKIKEKPARFGYSHMVKLLALEDRQIRQELLDKAIDEQWSVTELQRAVQARKGRRPDVGKKPTIPDDPLDVLLALQGLCIKFNRWCDEALDTLSGKVKKLTREANDAVKNAGEAVSERIKKLL
jgi:hypothetical protein